MLKLKPKIFCVPFAGGSSYSYNGFKKLATSVEIIPIELPGRGRRIFEPLNTDIRSLAEDVFNQVRPALDAPYAIYGHSMGSVVTYLVARRIVNENLPQPLHLFVTGRGGPSVPDHEPDHHQLPRDELMAKVHEMGGSPEEFLQNEDIIDHFEPIIRADFQAVETYQHIAEKPMDIPITCMIGDEEETTYEQALAWNAETTSSLEINKFPGKHFFIFDHDKEIISIIEKTVKVAMTMQTS